MILIVGATGLLGGAIARILLGQGRPVRALVRHDSPSAQLAQQGLATSTETLSSLGAELAYGDLRDPASLAAACQGVEAVIATANSALRSGDDNPETVELHGNRSLIDAAAGAGVKQFIFISANLADPNHPAPFLAGKGRSEAHLRASGMPYTIIAPNAYMEVWVAMVVGLPALTGQPVTVVGSGDRRHSFIAMGDVAAFAVSAIGNPQAINQRIVIGGPQPLSYREAAAAFGRALGRDIPVVSVNPGDPIPGLPPAMAAILPSFDLGDQIQDMSELPGRFGVQLTPLEEFVRRMAQPRA
jgi:NADH dehydrogenase